MDDAAFGKEWKNQYRSPSRRSRHAVAARRKRVRSSQDHDTPPALAYGRHHARRLPRLDRVQGSANARTIARRQDERPRRRRTLRTGQCEVQLLRWRLHTDAARDRAHHAPQVRRSRAGTRVSPAANDAYQRRDDAADRRRCSAGPRRRRQTGADALLRRASTVDVDDDGERFREVDGGRHERRQHSVQRATGGNVFAGETRHGTRARRSRLRARAFHRAARRRQPRGRPRWTQPGRLPREVPDAPADARRYRLLQQFAHGLALDRIVCLWGADAAKADPATVCKPQ